MLSAASVWLIGRYASTRFAKSWLRLTSWISVRQIGHWEERLSASDQHWRDGRDGRNTVPPQGYSTEGAKMVRGPGGGEGGAYRSAEVVQAGDSGHTFVQNLMTDTTRQV
eukprot:COSAG01_NODE_20877_length_930_cov_0.814681_2_plen_110_part_00